VSRSKKFNLTQCQIFDMNLVRRSSGPIRERNGAAAANYRRNDVDEAFVIARGVVELELRAEVDVEIVQRLDRTLDALDAYGVAQDQLAPKSQ
jgi:hypothetical protein